MSASVTIILLGRNVGRKSSINMFVWSLPISWRKKVIFLLLMIKRGENSAFCGVTWTRGPFIGVLWGKRMWFESISKAYKHFVFKMSHSRPLFRLFSVFSNKQYNFYNTPMWKMSCPPSIWRRDLNPQPLKHESSPITTRPGLPHYKHFGTNWSGVTDKRVRRKNHS